MVLSIQWHLYFSFPKIVDIKFSFSHMNIQRKRLCKWKITQVGEQPVFQPDSTIAHLKPTNVAYSAGIFIHLTVVK